MTVAGDWAGALVEHQGNNHFVEGPNNSNPWGPEQGVHNAAYCASAATIVAYHHGVRWPKESQFGEKGFAYSPFIRTVGLKLGFWKDGHNVDLLPGDLICFSWRNNGIADHTETVVAVYADGTFDTVGYNTGHPEGCHIPIRRDRKYLLGRWRMEGNFYSSTAGGHVDPGYPIPLTGSHIVDWTTVDHNFDSPHAGWSWILLPDGAVYAAPGAPALPGVNSHGGSGDYFAGRQAAKLHVRIEDGRPVSTVESSDGRLYRPTELNNAPNNAPPFRTH